MKIHNLYAGSWLSNCYVLISEDKNGKKRAAVIDPSADAKDITALLECENAVLDMIILTHGHFDHIMSLDDLRKMHASLPDSALIKSDLEWIEENYDELRMIFKKKSFFFSLGFMIFSAGAEA